MKFSQHIVLLWLLTCLLGATLAAQVSVIGDLSQERVAAPGESYDGVILVRNDTNEPQEVKVYQTDYLFKYDGTNDYGDPGSTPRSNAHWVAFNPSYLVLPALSTTAVNYTVAVPRDTVRPKLGGTYWSMLMVEGIPKGSAESSLPRKDLKAQMGILQTIRYGIQIVTNISNTGSRLVQFLNTKLIVTKDGTKALQVDVENTGELGMRPEVSVELFDSTGISRGKFSGIKYRIYPGTSVRQVIDLGNPPSGTYKALVVLDAGGDDVFGAQYTLKF